jgi:hypothetical protein
MPTAAVSATPFLVAGSVGAVLLVLMALGVIPGAGGQTRAQRTVLVGTALAISATPIGVLFDSDGLQAACAILGIVVVATGFVRHRRETA